MDQVSRPLLIALVAVVVLGAAWMTVLRPKPESDSAAAPLPTATAPAKPAPASSAPGVKGLTRAIDKAKGASQASDAANAATQAADPEQPAPAKTASAPATAAKPAAAKPAAAPAATPAKPAPRPHPALAARKIVLLFAGSGADDAVARQVVRSVHSRHVRTIIATLKQAGKYRQLIGDVRIEIAPTIVVIGRDRKARRIAGLPDVGQLRSALALAR